MLQLLRIVAIITVIILGNKSTVVRSESPPICGYSSKTSTCPGDDRHVKIRSPFWIENRTVDEMGRECLSHQEFQIKCAANGRPVINISSILYYVINIDRYSDSHISDGYSRGAKLTLINVAIDAQECPRPQRSFPGSTRFISDIQSLEIQSPGTEYGTVSNSVEMTIFYNCSRYPQNVYEHIPCLNQNNNINTSRRSFAFIEQEISSNQYNWSESCEEAVWVLVESHEYRNPTIMNYTQALKDGFSLTYLYPFNCRNCELSGGKCDAAFVCNCKDASMNSYICRGRYSYSYYGYNIGLSNSQKIVLGISMGIGGLLLSLLVFYRRKCYPLFNSTISRCRKKIKGPTNVEMFLDNNCGGLSLQNYKYLDVKKMTNSFKDTLGQGGYGSVFKGKLRDGRLVAVKLLTDSKGKGEDFINEVATIGRTNHVNVVSLLGFCAEGTKRALIYEFMQNGSLEKFIHNAKDSSTTGSFLGWEKLYEIALGIARGLEYLHRGCNTRILHFDIKPHNILLDQDFRPKISDFGLAKLCPTTASLVSMVGARGTPGYIAPEVCCGNFGGVSHKSDVYSYGMMVLEMIGGRKNMDVFVENASQIYFPQWIYKRLRGNDKVEEPEEIEVTDLAGGVLKEETVRKMIIMALWCIQAHPADRPSITKVVEQLEGNIEDLQFPPNPFPDPSSSSSVP